MLYPEIITQIEKLDASSISKERKVILDPLIQFIQSKKIAEEDIRINFICTHFSNGS